MSSSKNFGLTFSVIFLLISLWPLLDNSKINFLFLVLSISFLVISLTFPSALKPLNILWHKFGMFLAKILNPLIMGIIYFFIVTPIALVLKLIKKDVLELKNNKSDSYWKERKEPQTRMDKQF